jgi:hypothetical protein
LLTHSEKIEVTRSASPFERSLVPMGRAHRCYTRVVWAFLLRTPQTCGTKPARHCTHM